MDEIYLKIWELAKPYYEKGRIYDLDQIEWMMKQGERIADNIGVDKEIFLPLIILHDVGYYFVVNKNPHIKDKISKSLHTVEGAKIAKKILGEVGYEPQLTEMIVQCVLKHDNWAFGDDKPYQESKLMALFNDLDFLYVNSSFEAFKTTGESMGLNPKKFYEFWINDEKLVRRPFCCAETKKMWETSIKQIEHQLNKL